MGVVHRQSVKRIAGLREGLTHPLLSDPCACCARCRSRTAVAPLERLKILMQVQGNEKIYRNTWQVCAWQWRCAAGRGLCPSCMQVGWQMYTCSRDKRLLCRTLSLGEGAHPHAVVYACSQCAMQCVTSVGDSHAPLLLYVHENDAGKSCLPGMQPCTLWVLTTDACQCTRGLTGHHAHGPHRRLGRHVQGQRRQLRADCAKQRSQVPSVRVYQPGERAVGGAQF